MPCTPDSHSSCKEFCEKSYSASYAEFMISKTDTDHNRALARKFAIGNTTLAAMKRFQEIHPEDIWRIVNKIHIKWYSDMELEPEVVEKIISARQSWVKSSGHAFEEMVKAECNKALSSSNIIVLLQRDLSSNLKKNKVSNLPKDIAWLKQECKRDVFDLYICRKENDGTYRVFGCLQAKTSVRDRVTRDREPSQRAMKKKFWSVIFVFDAEFLHRPKFIEMVNGGGDEFEDNGWHFAYSYDSSFNNGRIKYIGDNLSTFVEDALLAVEKFTGEERALRTADYPQD